MELCATNDRKLDDGRKPIKRGKRDEGVIYRARERDGGAARQCERTHGKIKATKKKRQRCLMVLLSLSEGELTVSVRGLRLTDYRNLAGKRKRKKKRAKRTR